MKSLWKGIRGYFEFSKNETKGLIILASIVLFFLLAMPQLPKFFVSTNPSVSLSFDKKTLDSLVALLNKIDTASTESRSAVNYTKYNLPDKTKINYQPKDFNPNTSTENELIAMGLPEKVAKNMVNYRKKGGVFKVKKDFRRVYGITDELFAIFEPHLLLPDSLPKNTYISNKPFPFVHNNSVVADKAPKKADINTADSLQLIKCYGIGAKRASIILKYRTALGGFIKMEQLDDVWGLDSTAKAALSATFEIKKNFHPRQLPINQAELDALVKHPYITKTDAKIILAYRNTHKFIPDSTTWLRLQGIDEVKKRKILPYLSFF